MGVSAKSWEVLRVAQDDSGIVVLTVVCRPERSEGSPLGLVPRVGRSLAFARDDSGIVFLTVVLSS
ncbi:hypothetical protein [Legionella maceachernii]|uniref:hypothetical protein n=1 Tax=Legionella maceachernii TaxID=466 RepID=UPI0010545673|nr:hypothetical protein [Legionella maceachernii]